jgi:hypothetical protein
MATKYIPAGTEYFEYPAKILVEFASAASYDRELSYLKGTFPQITRTMSAVHLRSACST